MQALVLDHTWAKPTGCTRRREPILANANWRRMQPTDGSTEAELLLDKAIAGCAADEWRRSAPSAGP